MPPVVSMSIVRLFLCLVNLLDLDCDQMDVVTAFVNGELDEEIFMEFANTTSLSENDAVQNVALQSLVHSASSSTYWIIDSGCISHVTFDRSAFNSYTAVSVVSNFDLGTNSSAPICLLDAVMSGWI